MKTYQELATRYWELIDLSRKSEEIDRLLGYLTAEQLQEIVQSMEDPDEEDEE